MTLCILFITVGFIAPVYAGGLLPDQLQVRVERNILFCSHEFEAMWYAVEEEFSIKLGETIQQTEERIAPILYRLRCMKYSQRISYIPLEIIYRGSARKPYRDKEVWKETLQPLSVVKGILVNTSNAQLDDGDSIPYIYVVTYTDPFAPKVYRNNE